MIATTLNIHIDILTEISQCAATLKKSRKEVIIQLLKRMMKNHHLFTRGFSTVKYQPHDKKRNWRCFHIRFKPDENEFFVDLRKFCKISVSYLLAIAVARYLDSLAIEDEGKGVDKYSNYCNYVMHRDVVEGIIYWQIFWGFPEEHLKTLNL